LVKDGNIEYGNIKNRQYRKKVGTKEKIVALKNYINRTNLDSSASESSCDVRIEVVFESEAVRIVPLADLQIFDLVLDFCRLDKPLRIFFLECFITLDYSKESMIVLRWKCNVNDHGRPQTFFQGERTHFLPEKHTIFLEKV
jgi:hypothetical protein